MHHTKQKGFTLIEMLVVLGVLVIIALLGVPVLIAQAERGRSAACIVKLRNLAVAMTQFRLERNHRMWNLQPVASGGEGGLAPAQVLYRYGLIRSGKELCCPSATSTSASKPTKKAWTTGGVGSPDYMRDIANQPVSYAVSGMAFYRFTPWYSSTSVTDYRYYLGHESKTPLFMDGTRFQLNLTSWQFPMRMTALALRHQDRCHVLFADGHVEALNRREVERLDPNGGKNPAWLKQFGMDE